jgi:hypothetical protein
VIRVIAARHALTVYRRFDASPATACSETPRASSADASEWRVHLLSAPGSQLRNPAGSGSRPPFGAIAPLADASQVLAVRDELVFRAASVRGSASGAPTRRFASSAR